MIFLSVIIPTKNRSALLRQTLQSLIHQTYSQENFEIIVVDNNSEDDTKEIAYDFMNKFRNIHYVFTQKPGLHEGRHAGLKNSNGEILVYTDDDIHAFPTWLEGIYESFLNERVGLVGGKNIPLYESVPPYWMEKLWMTVEQGKYMPDLSLLDFGNKVQEVNPHFIFGCNFSIRKCILTQIKGFHPDGMPHALIKFRGDGETFVAEQVEKLGYVTLYNPKASINHYVPTSRMSSEYINKRAFNEGVSASFADARKEKLENRKIGFLKRNKRRIEILFCKGMQKDIKRSYLNGYFFHQQELKKDKDLLTWVMKDNYLD